MLYSLQSHWNDIFNCKSYPILFPINVETFTNTATWQHRPGDLFFAQSGEADAFISFSQIKCLFTGLWHIIFSLYNIKWIINIIIGNKQSPTDLVRLFCSLTCIRKIKERNFLLLEALCLTSELVAVLDRELFVVWLICLGKEIISIYKTVSSGLASGVLYARRWNRSLLVFSLAPAWEEQARTLY